MRKPRAAPLSLEQFENTAAREWPSYLLEIEATIMERDRLRAELNRLVLEMKHVLQEYP